MPLPSPTGSGKKAQQDFMEKCMHAMKDEKRPQDQKIAICMSTWRRRKKSKESKGDTSEPLWEEQVVKNEDGDCIIL
jgi:hypothetical protein